MPSPRRGFCFEAAFQLWRPKINHFRIHKKCYFPVKFVVIVHGPDRPIMHPLPFSQNPPTLYFSETSYSVYFKTKIFPGKKIGSTVYFTDRHFTDQGFFIFNKILALFKSKEHHNEAGKVFNKHSLDKINVLYQS